MIQSIVLLVTVVTALLLGAVGAPAFATSRAALRRMPLFDLSDETIAHIAHEAGRAYELSLGIIEQKTWNNLTPITRDARTARIAVLRRGGTGIICQTWVQHRLELAILTLVQPNRS